MITLSRLRDQIREYNEQLFIYDTERVEYNKKINEIKGMIRTNNPPVAQESDNGILSAIFGAANDLELFIIQPEDYELPEIPDAPTPPDEPFFYTGPLLGELTPTLGYGTFSHGEIRMRDDYGTKKFFGVFGQGARNQEDKGFVFTQDTFAPENDVRDCLARYYALSVFPIEGDFVQGPERLGFTAMSEKANNLDFTMPPDVTAARNPATPPTQLQIDEYYEKWETAIEEAKEGSMMLATSGAMVVALLATTLY